jgi:hypothetical protein
MYALTNVRIHTTDVKLSLHLTAIVAPMSTYFLVIEALHGDDIIETHSRTLALAGRAALLSWGL